MGSVKVLTLKQIHCALDSGTGDVLKVSTPFPKEKKNRNLLLRTNFKAQHVSDTKIELKKCLENVCGQKKAKLVFHRNAQ